MLVSWFGIIFKTSTVWKRRLASLQICIRGLEADLVSTGSIGSNISRDFKARIEVSNVFFSIDLSAVCDVLTVLALIAGTSVAEKWRLWWDRSLYVLPVLRYPTPE